MILKGFEQMDRRGLICRYIKEHPQYTQRELAQGLKMSVGAVNALVKDCVAHKLVQTQGGGLTERGEAFLEDYRVDGALIIAAGFGSRFVPLTFETPKGLLEVFGERMIERMIRQLHEAGVKDITIAVGYLKEKFEYLIDKYQVSLLYNPEYYCKNTLATVWQARETLRGRNMYLLASDHWMRENLFHAWECGSWYASSYMKGETSEWALSFNKKGRITGVEIGGKDAWVMYGPAFFTKTFSEKFLAFLEEAYHRPGTEQLYWEQVLREHIGELEIYVNRQDEGQVYEFENLEELRVFDKRYQDRSDNKAMELVAGLFNVAESEIHDIRCLKAGMTNQSFLFQTGGRHYICRIPGKGTELLINRAQEAKVYEAIRELGISEHVLYLDAGTGYKVSEYYEGARNADSGNMVEMGQCMALLRRLHNSGLRVEHRFDIRERIDFYEGLCEKREGTLFEDYGMVREWMNELMEWLKGLGRKDVLCHIDSVADNFLFLPDGGVRLIDWEYGGMCDPLMDVGMCAIYSYYDEEQAEQLLDLYLGREAKEEERMVTFACMALGGFLWSLWGVYKQALGVEFGDYTMKMYRYAKEYYWKVKKACCHNIAASLIRNS